MPLRAEHRQYYRADWKAFRLELIEAEGGKFCGECGVEHERINGAHLNHDPRDRSKVGLRCPSCHATHDAGHRIAIQRRRKAAAEGQAWLLPEMEWSPFAAWEIPGWIFDRLQQLKLF